jgi:uncharacterized membrane protein YfcA
MPTDPWFYAVAIAAVTLTGLSKGGFLGGVGGVAVPLMSLVISPVQAAAIMLPILIAMDWMGVWAYRHEWSRPNLKIMLPAATVGILVGWWMAKVVNDAHVKLMVGIIGVTFAANWLLGLAPRTAVPGPNWLKGSIFGAISGFTSFVSHTGGPPFAVYMLPQRLPNAVYAGSAVMFFTAVNLIKVPPYLFLGQFDASNLLTAAVLTLPGVAAMAAGIWLTRRVPQGPFYRIVYGFLLLISAKLIWDGGRALFG